MLEVLIFIALSAILIFLIGHSWIDSYFQRKEEVMNRMMQQGRGEV